MDDHGTTEEEDDAGRPEEDPKADVDRGVFLASAVKVLEGLKKDLLARSVESEAVTAALQRRHAWEKAQERTADPFKVWRAHFVGQVAASWLLGCVFVRVLEDRGLLGSARIAGPGAADSQRAFFELAPSLSERDYLAQRRPEDEVRRQETTATCASVTVCRAASRSCSMGRPSSDRPARF